MYRRDWEINLKQKIDHLITFLMPLSLISSGYINICLYYFGLHSFDSIRRILFILLLSIIFIASLIKLFFLFQNYPQKRRKMLSILMILVFWLLIFLIAFIKFQMQSYIIKTFLTFGIYCIPAFIFAVSIAIEKKGEQFIKSYKWYTLFILPIIFYYIGRIILAPKFDPNLLNLGAIGYLVLGYTLFTMTAFCLLDLVLYKQDKSVLKIIIILLTWLACIFTGAKGPILCMLVFLSILFTYLLFQRAKQRNFYILSFIMMLMLFFQLFIYAPPSSGIWRINVFTKNISNKVIMAFSDSNDQQAFIDLVKNTPNNTRALELVSGDSSTSENNEVDQKKFKTNAQLYESSWERLFLFRLALTEGYNSPLTGLGPMGYTLKYGIYPHNIIAELIADLGYIVTIMFVIVMSSLYMLLYKKAKRNQTIALLFIYIVSSIPEQMLTGTVYSSISLLFTLGFITALPKDSSHNVQ